MTLISLPTGDRTSATTADAVPTASGGVARRSGRRSPWALLEALVTPHGLDRYLELVNPMLTVRELRARIVRVERRVGSTTLTLRPTRQWGGFRAGQYVQLSVDIDGVRRTRCFSPSSSEHRRDGRFELTIKAHPGGLVSNYLLDAARPGLVVGLAQADGVFRLPETRPGRILLISGGSGVTPVLSMLRTLVDEGYAGEVTFLHYVDTVGDVVHLDELRALAAAHPNVGVSIVTTADESGDLAGLFDAAQLPPGHAAAETYLCGPAPLMDAVRAHYDVVGLGDRLHWEEFTLAASFVPDGDAIGRVTFERSGGEIDNSGSTLLEQAEAAGLNPSYGCRMGICFTCTSPKISGCVKHVRTGELDTDPDTQIQLCVSVPVGDVTLGI